MTNLEVDELFIAELKKGHKWQLWVGLQFLKEGFIVQVPNLKIRKNHDEINKYSDSGDVIVFLNNERYSFECKSRNLEFTNKENYPYDTVFVDRTKTWERKRNNKPLAIIIISQQTGKLVVVSSKTEKYWMIEERIDSVRNYTRSYYMVDKKYLHNWDFLIDHLRIKGRINGTLAL